MYDGAAGLVDQAVAGVLRVSSLPLVAHLHGGAAIVAVRRVLHVLNTTVRKSNLREIIDIQSSIIVI